MLKVTIIHLLIVLIVSSMLGLVGCKKRSNRLYAPFIISPNGEELAFNIGPPVLKGKPPPVEPEPYFVGLGKDTASQAIPLPKFLLPMAWRPGASPPELFGVSRGLLVPPYRILAVAVSDDNVSTVLSQELPGELWPVRMAWNPSGQILAAEILGSNKTDTWAFPMTRARILTLQILL